MPFRQKNKFGRAKKILLAIIIVALIVLMIISFAPTQHLTEIVLN